MNDVITQLEFLIRWDAKSALLFDLVKPWSSNRDIGCVIIHAQDIPSDQFASHHYRHMILQEHAEKNCGWKKLLLEKLSPKYTLKSSALTNLFLYCQCKSVLAN